MSVHIWRKIPEIYNPVLPDFILNIRAKLEGLHVLNIKYNQRRFHNGGLQVLNIKYSPRWPLGI